MSEAVTRRCTVKYVFLKMSQNLLENSRATVPRPEACNFVKKETPTEVFSSKFVNFVRTIFLLEHLRWLLLRCLQDNEEEFETILDDNERKCQETSS